MKKNNVKQTLKEGLVSNTSHVKICALVNPDNHNQQNAQIAFIVSKKVHASAVQRHRYQRWMREVAMQQKKSIPNNIMLVLIAKPNMKEVKSFRQLQEILSPHLATQKTIWKNLSKQKS